MTYPKTIMMMGAVYKFRTIRDTRAWALRCVENNEIADPTEFGARMLFTVKPISTVEDIAVEYGMENRLHTHKEEGS